MAIEIHIESSWETDDGEGRQVEVTVVERTRPSEDPVEDSRFFASGDLDELKRYLCDLIESRRTAFMVPARRECRRCRQVSLSDDKAAGFICPSCRSLA